MHEMSVDLAPFQPVGVVTRTELAKPGVCLEALHVATSKIKPSAVLGNILFLEKVVASSIYPNFGSDLDGQFKHLAPLDGTYSGLCGQIHLAIETFGAVAIFATTNHLTVNLSIISGAIFEQGTDEVQSAFKFAMLNHNQNVTARRFELHSYVDVINTADAYKLSHLSK
jgi:hypothetical protein